MYCKAGQTLIEVVMGLAIILVTIAGAIHLSIGYLNTLQRSSDLNEVSSIAQEGFEALQSVAYDSWAILTDGTHGLTQSGVSWQLQVNPDLIQSIYTRSILITPVYRDNNCNIVATPGTNDPDTKKITMTISWSSGGSNYSETFEKYFTNWKNPTPLCTSTQAGSLVIDVSDACMEDQSKQLVGVVFQNIASGSITVEFITVSWEKDGVTTGFMQSIKIDGTDHWHSTNGIGSPPEDQPSGTEINIVDKIVLGSTLVPVDRFRFKDKLVGYTFIIKAKMADASQKEATTGGFVPTCEND